MLTSVTVPAEDDDPGVAEVHRLAMECLRESIGRPGIPRPSVARLDMLERRYGPEYAYAVVMLLLTAWHNAVLSAHPGIDDAGLRRIADTHLATGRAVGDTVAGRLVASLVLVLLDPDDPEELRSVEIWDESITPRGLRDEVLRHLLVMVKHAWHEIVAAGVRPPHAAF